MTRSGGGSLVGLAPIESAAESGSLVAAEGSAQMSAEEMKALVSDKDIKTTLDIYLLMSDGSRVTQFNGMYQIKLLLPAELRGMSGLQVVYVADDGKVEVFETVREGNYLTFTTAHFSEFLILGDTELDLWWLIITLSVLLAIELVAILLIALSKKKKGEDGADGGKGDAQNKDEAQGEKQGDSQKGAAAKMNMVFSPLLAVNLIPSGAVPAVIVLGVLVLVAAAVIIAMLIKGSKQEEPAEEPVEEPVEEPKEEPAEEPVEEPAEEPVEEPAEPAEAAEEVSVTQTEQTQNAALFAAGAAGAAGLVIGQTFIRYRYDRSFEARLIQSSDEVKGWYSELKNELLSYEKAHGRRSWRHEAYRRGRPTVAKFVFRGKTLCLCLALAPKAYEESKYIVDDMSGYARFEATPLLYRLKNPRRVRYAKELIAALFAPAQMLREENTDYSDIPFESTQALLERGLIREVGQESVVYDGTNYSAEADDELEEEREMCEEPAEPAEEPAAEPATSAEPVAEPVRAAVTVSEANARMTDEEAEAAVEEGVRFADKTKTGIVNVDTLSELFSEGEKVTLEELKKRFPYLSKKVTYIKVLARGRLDKPLIVEADEFSLEAVKMIVLEGGKVIRTLKKPN